MYMRRLPMYIGSLLMWTPERSRLRPTLPLAPNPRPSLPTPRVRKSGASAVLNSGTQGVRGAYARLAIGSLA